MSGRIGYLREAKLGGRIGRIRPVGRVGARGHKAEVKVEEHKWKGGSGSSSRQ